MFKRSESFQNAQNSGINENFKSIKVLVVDHKKDLLEYVADVLHSCSFEATCVDNSGAALRLISEKKKEFDLLLIDSDMGDVDIHTFLKLTKNIHVLSIVMSEQEDDALLLDAIKSGAFLVVKRPLTIEAMRHIRQDVIRERMHKYEKCMNKNMILNPPKQEIASFGNKYCNPRKQVSRINFDNNQVYQCSENDLDFGSMRKKICVEWTEELHDKFLNAVTQLGEGRCYPREILNLMGVPGLTRMQVASHLQKCRKEKWKSDEKRCTLTPSWKHKLTEINERKFGCMPSLQTDHSREEENNTLIGFNLSINGWQTGVNHVKNQTYRDSSTMKICNQKNIEQHTLYTSIPFGRGFGTNQDEGFGSRITKTSNNYFQQVMSGLRDAEQGSSDRRQASDDFSDFLKDLDGNGPNDI